MRDVISAISDSGDNSGVVEVRLAKGKVVLWTLLAVVNTTAGIIAAYLFPRDYTLPMPVTFCIQVLFLVAVLIVFGRGVFRGLMYLMSFGPVITVTDAGMTLDFRLPGRTLIAWSEIEGLVAYRTRVQTVLNIGVIDYHPILARKGAIGSTALVLMQWQLTRRRLIIIGDAMFQTSIAHLLEQINRQQRSQLDRYGIRVQMMS